MLKPFRILEMFYPFIFVVFIIIVILSSVCVCVCVCVYRIWHKVNFLAIFNRSEFRFFFS